MSLLAVQGGATGSGTVTLLAPITNTNRTLTLPDVTDTVAGIAATQTLTNKTLTSPTLTTPNVNSAQVDTVSGTAPLYFCRAWVNFNGTGTVAIRASGNVSSITDNGTSDYTINFTTAMPDTNYCAVIYAYEENYYVINAAYGQTKNTGLFSIGGYYTNASSGTWSLTQRDIPHMNVAIFR